jgi:hypothetical protein
MTAAVVVHEPRELAGNGQNGRVIAFRPEQEFAALLNMGQHLISTGFLPTAIRTPAQAAAIILTGRELGIQPMHALRSIHVIQGKPGLAAELQLGLFHRAGGLSKVIKSDDEVCEMWFRHPNGMEHTERFSMEDAKRAELLGKDGWKKYKKSMLRARTISFGLRIAAPDIVAGMYDPEELGADLNAAGEIVIPEHLLPTPTPAPEPPKDMTIEEAAAFPSPFQKGTANYNKPFGDMSSGALRKLAEWIVAKREENGNKSFQSDPLTAISLVLGAREAGQLAEPPKKEKAAEKAAAGSKNVKMEKGGKVEDAIATPIAPGQDDDYPAALEGEEDPFGF